MKSKLKHVVLGGLFAVASLFAFSSSVKAALTQSIDIKVSISATKSVAVNTTYYHYGALGVNTSSVSATAIVVTNDSAALVETYTLQGANAASTAGSSRTNPRESPRSSRCSFNEIG